MSAPQVSQSKAKSKPNSKPKSTQSEIVMVVARTKPEPKPKKPEPVTPGSPAKSKPASKPTSKPKPQPKSWSMYPARHAEVLRLLDEAQLEPKFHTEDDEGASSKHDTNIMGRFRCWNPACRKKGWSSNCIPITIRYYEPSGYNARVYHQRCQSCNYLAKPQLDTSYEERVAYRIKVWCGIDVQRPNYSSQSRGPHQRDLCEGCRHGHCRESED